MVYKILVVDDINFNLTYFQLKFANEPYEIFLANNGEEAITKAEEIDPDIIIMDVMMPVMDGLTATKKIKNNIKTCLIPIIMASALYTPEDKIIGLEHGAIDYIPKPINFEALKVKISTYVKKKISLQYLIKDNYLNNSKTDNIDGITKPSKSQHRILLIDDDHKNYSVINEKFKSTGYSFLSSTTGEYSDLMQNNDFSLIIVNTTSITQDPVLFCKAIQTDLGDIPVLIIIDDYEEETLLKCIETGINGHIKSPIDKNELICKLNNQIKNYKLIKFLKEKFNKNIFQDSLTKIYNRNFKENNLPNILKDSPQDKYIIYYIDIDNFKNINDTYSHNIGDKILIDLAQTLQNLTFNNGFSIRMGGDELCIIIANDSDNSESIESLNNLNHRKFSYKASNIPVIEYYASIGRSNFIYSADTLDEKIHEADEDMFKNKQKNKLIRSR